MKNKFLSRIGQWHTPPYLRKCLTSLKPLTLLLVMLMSVNVWGADTYSMTPDQTTTGSSATAYITSLTEFTHDEVSWKMNQWNPKTLQIKTNQSFASSEFRFYNTSAFAGKITQVVVKFSALTLSNTTTTGFKFVGGSSEVSGTTGGTDGVWNSTAKTLTWTPDAESNYTYFAMYQNGKVATGTNNLATADAIVVTYESGDTPSKELVSVAVSGNPTKTTYEAGETFNPAGLTVTGTYSEDDPEVITSGITWNVTPSGALTAGTISVSVTATVSGKTSPAYVVNGLTVTAALPKITITADKIAEFDGSYKEYTWTANDVTGKCWAYRGGSSESYNIQFNKTTYVYNTTAVPGRITSIKMTKVSGTTRTWSIYGADEALTGDNYTTTGTQIGSAQEVSSETGTTWNVPNDKNYTYFYITKADGGTNIGEIVITYEEDNTPSISADVEEIEFEQKELSGTVTDSKVISATGKNLTAAISASMKPGSAAVFSVTPVGTPTAAAGEFTVSYSTTEAGEYAGTVVLSSGETSLEIPVSASVVAHIPVLQSVAVSGAPTKTDYTEGEEFETAGLIVTGTYDVGEPQPITEGISWTIDPSGALEFGTTSVNVQATVDGITSEAYSVTITVAKAPLSVTWNLTIDETATATENEISWTSDFATMIDEKGESTTPANNYYPGTSGKTYTSTRFYGKSVLTIAPVDNNVITKVEFTATSNSYAKVLKGSTWTNAAASMDDETTGTLVTVTPTDGTQAFSATIGGTCGFESVKVYYQPGATMTSIAVKTAPSKVVYNAGESFNPAGLVITATYDDASTKDITYDANDTKWEFAPGLTDKLDATDDEVIISYNDIMCEDALEITVNRIASNLAAVSATKILVVDDAPSLADWYTIAANYDGTVSFQSNNEDVFYVEGAEGLALAAGSATLTITAPQTDTYAQASVTVAVTVNAAAVPCSVKWMNNGEEYTVGNPSTTVNAGQKVTKLPTAPTPCDAQHVFKGWTNAVIETPQATAPAILFTDAASAPTVDADNTVYYAVYAVESPGSDVLTKMVVGNTLANGDKIVIVAHKDGDLTDDVAMYQETVSSSYVNKYAFDGNINSVLANNKNWLTVNTKEGGFSLGDATNGYIYSSGNNLYCGETAQVWTLNDLEDGTFKLQSGGRNLSYRYDLSSQYWRMGGASYGTSGQTVLDIYKIEAGDVVYSDYSTTCAAIELDKIELSGTYPTTFLVGDAFSHEGMTVTASYTNSTTTKNVTNLATFTDKTTGEAVDMSAAGSKTILVSYTEDENTKTAEYDITINDWPNKTIAEFIAAKGVKCYLTALVSNLDGNNYDLTDNSGTIHGYKYTLADGVSALANGDRIRVRAEEYTTFQDAPEVMNIVVIEKLAYSAIAVSGTMSVTEYTEGNTLNSDGLVVKGKYSDEDEATHVITEGITWNMPTAVLGTSEYDVTATVGTLNSPAYHVTGITVNAAKVLTGIAITTEPKKTFWVGENFSTAGIQVTASYDGAEDADVTALCSFSRAEAQITDAIENETITVSYTEGTETKTATYTINANWMTLADLVENVTPTGTAVKVWVKITDALVKERNNSYLTTDVTYGDSQTKEVKIYKSGVDATWVAGGTISGDLKGVDWKLFNSDWELMPNDWTWATYTPAAPTPVTGVSLNEDAIEVKAGKTATLVATVTPDNATDKSVTWAIINDNANGKITVSDAGVVSVAADATEGATATVQVTTTDGGFTATCNVTVVVPVMTNYYLVTDASTLHVGDIIVMAVTYNDKTYVNGSLSGDYLTSAEATLIEDRLSTADACEFVLGGEPGAWTLTSVDGTLGATKVKKLTYDNTQTSFVGTWTISIDEDNNATIAPDANGYGRFLYNHNGGTNSRFLTYTSDLSASMLLPQIYHRYKETVRENVTEGTIGTMVYEHNITAIAGAVIYEPDYVNGNELEFIEVLPENTVAGLPYIFVANGENDGKVQVNFGTEEPAIDCDYTNRGLKGNMGPEAIYVSDPAYVIYQDQIRPANNTKVAVGRAYIADIQDLYALDPIDALEPIVTDAPRRRFSLGIERNTPTGFETIMMQKGMNKVIMNNQLFIIRDGKLFNAQGALVK